MLLVKIPRTFYEKNIPEDDLFTGHLGENIRGLVVNDGLRTYFSPLLNVAELTHTISDPESFVNLSDEPDTPPEDIIALEKTIVLEDEFFDEEIATLSLLPPNEYRQLKTKETEFLKGLSNYVVGYQMNPTDPKYKKTSLNFFKNELEIYESSLEVKGKDKPLVQPFYDVHTQKQYDLLEHTVDPQRIEHHDREKFQKTKEKELNLE